MNVIKSRLESGCSASDIRDLHHSLHTSSELVRDECGGWNIIGSRATIYTDGQFGDDWYLYTKCSWSRVKRALSFMQLHQDGDHEGVLKLDRFPTSEEARLIRKWVGLGTKKSLSADRKAKLVEAGRKFRFSHGPQPKKIDLTIHSNGL
jgi:hypothetical protein